MSISSIASQTPMEPIANTETIPAQQTLPRGIDQFLPPKEGNNYYDFTAGVNFLPRCFVKIFQEAGYFFHYCASKLYQFSYFVMSKLMPYYFEISSTDITFGGEMQAGSISQSNVAMRDVYRILQPGQITCTYMAGMAAEQFLREDLNIDLTVARGLARALKHYGVHIPEEFFAETNSCMAIQRLQGIVSELDRENSEILDYILQTQSVFEAWDDGAVEAFPHLETAVDFDVVVQSDELRAQFGDLVGQLESSQTTREKYLRSLTCFAQMVQPSSVGAAVFTRPPSSYSFSIKKDEFGNVSEVSFFDSHGCSLINPSYYSGAYAITWRRQNDAHNVLENAADFLTWLSPYRRRGVDYYTFTPLTLLRDEN